MEIKHIKNDNLELLKDYIKDRKHVFILIYMNGCGPCNATKPEWFKMGSALEQQYPNKNDVAIVDVEQTLLPEIEEYVGSADGFPTMKYITNNGKNIELYENSGIKKKDRSVDSFINWVESKITEASALNEQSSPHHVSKRIKQTNKNNSIKSNKSNKNKNKKITHKKIHKGGRKWSRKYKSSINCKRPKGFSQMQYCKYGRNKK